MTFQGDSGVTPDPAPLGGRRQRAVAQKIRRTPHGGAGRDWTFSRCSAESEEQAPPPSAGPSKLEPKILHFSCLSFRTLFFMQDLQNLAKVYKKSCKDVSLFACISAFASAYVA